MANGPKSTQEFLRENAKIKDGNKRNNAEHIGSAHVSHDHRGRFRPTLPTNPLNGMNLTGRAGSAISRLFSRFNG